MKSDVPHRPTEKSNAGVDLWFDEHVPDATYCRASDVLWRAGPDRVLVRRIGHVGIDLLGVAAMVWIALDVPRPIAEVEHEISSLLDEPVDVRATVDALVADRLVVSSAADAIPGEDVR